MTHRWVFTMTHDVEMVLILVAQYINYIYIYYVRSAVPRGIYAFLRE